MRILNVNIRGFKKDGKESWFKNLVSANHPVIAAVQETKINSVSDTWVETLWGSQNVGYAVKHPTGRSGGLMLIWDTSSFCVNQAVEGEFFIAIKGKLQGRDGEIVVVNVYGPHRDSKKIRFWSSLNELLKFPGVAWVVCGDFNEVRSNSERKNCTFVESRAILFNDFIVNNGLIEIPLLGKRYTRISDDSCKLSKLD
ncbi:uncharacterized protein [Rutidosis leptorrhynchoides]|uniref:uncharacterized protein n=1 Tax=Rutidosis leptorrhynchoides TaxID=125765 RepID=UPI003A99C1CD